ncbi:cobyrinate a,c-diamide synthase [Saliniramus sp.]|uniref:cobyrinate a,c-diamide synthase n=1 Tax=Saliniramus sp. TaxID=2986772 RepID=UPI002BE03306|nr:cobyrinate a,c-diamide synthase [Saliniramus sp.]HMB11883.1 cobyrinate a,c-diamide synthase [Saliniramus sp.]
MGDTPNPAPTPAPRGLIIAAPRSGSGKTTVTLGIQRALSRRGLTVQPFKCGPDYIDPAFHSAAARRPSFNLDSWAFTRAQLAELLARGSDSDIAIAEGSMGLFDGVAQPGASGDGSNADIAALTEWPVILVIDVSGQAQSAAAIALGCRLYRDDITLAGVILNRVASPRHDMLLRKGMEKAGIPVLGAMPKRADLVLPERHLGLVQAGDTEDLAARLDALADFAQDHIDLDALTALAAPSRLSMSETRATPVTPPGQRIALARDAAFSFVYPHLLDRWRAAGAEIIPFSPLADVAPDPACDVVWLPGGYPELHAGRLAQAQNFRKGLHECARTRPVHGECGGYMALGAGLIDAEGVRHEMAGLIGLETSFAKRSMHLGYRHATLHAPIPGHAPGAALRGHEFHYTTILAQPDEPLARVVDANGKEVPETGSRRGHVTGSFFHLISAFDAHDNGA